MKLPFGSGKNQPAKSQSAKSESVQPSNAFSLRSQMLLLVVAGVLLVAVPPVV